jgi:predicted amidohydrolase
VHIRAASGPARRDGGRFVNAARLFAPSGAMGVQEKLLMTPFERDWGVSPGSALRVFDTALGRIGVAICYDSEFPLLVRAQAEAGARIVLIPSCTEFPSGFSRVRTAALARALESALATVLSPTIGDAPWLPGADRSFGAAGVYVPADRDLSDTGVLAEGSPNTPRWVFADVDLARLARVTAAGEMRNSTDWSLQPGAAPLAQRAELVPLA